jgi:hypothetical protein
MCETAVEVKLVTCDPAARVQAGLDGKWTTWNITQNLTDRCGDLNFNGKNTDAVVALMDAGALSQMREQMWSEGTFVVRKDGAFGILFEVEFTCSESEDEAEDPDFYAKLKPREQVVAALLAGMATMQAEFPEVLFAVPHENEVIFGRPAAWAYVRDGLLTEEQRQSLGEQLFDL